MILRDFTDRIGDFRPDVLIVGSGLGGLLVGAMLAKRGVKVLITEKLSRVGGRFTARRVDGHEIPTGALHLIPHGKRGPLGKILRKDLKISLKIHPLQYFSSWKWKKEPRERRHQLYQAIFLMMPDNHDKWFLLKMLRDVPKRHEFRQSFEEYLNSLGASLDVKGFFSAILGFSMALELHQVSTSEVFEFFYSLFKYGRPGIPEGGLRNLTEQLTALIRKQGGRIVVNAKVVELCNSRSTHEIDAVVIKTRNGEGEVIIQNPKVVVSNVGPFNTFKLLSDIHGFDHLLRKRIPSATGAKFVYSTRRPILGHSGVTFYPENKWVKGCAEPTHLVPNLAPKGHHLFIAYVTFQEKSSETYRQQLKKAREELLTTYPQLDKWGEEISIQTHDQNWPVNWVRQDIHLKPRINDVENLWLVGDGFKPSGLIMSEGIAAVAKKVVKQIYAFLNDKKIK